MPPQKRFPKIGGHCVGCGACANVCPVSALSVPRGLRAVPDTRKCVGCGKCERACPAGVITMEAAPDA